MEVPMPEREEHRDERKPDERGSQPQPGTAEPMDASAHAASASESGGLYREEGATLADRQGDPVGEGEQVGDEEEGEQPEDRPGVGDVWRSGS
jgi:hypothetical protein